MSYYNEQETKNRIEKVKGILKSKGLDAALIYYDELNIANGWYLTGWCPQFEKRSRASAGGGRSASVRRTGKRTLCKNEQRGQGNTQFFGVHGAGRGIPKCNDHGLYRTCRRTRWPKTAS